MVERDKIFVMIGSMGSLPRWPRRIFCYDAGVLQLFPLTAAEFTFKFDPAKPQERLKFQPISVPYVREHARPRSIHDGAKNFKKPCIMHQDDGTAKRAGRFNQQLDAMKGRAGFDHELQARCVGLSAQVAKMKSDVATCRARHRDPRDHRWDE